MWKHVNAYDWRSEESYDFPGTLIPKCRIGECLRHRGNLTSAPLPGLPLNIRIPNSSQKIPRGIIYYDDSCCITHIPYGMPDEDDMDLLNSDNKGTCGNNSVNHADSERNRDATIDAGDPHRDPAAPGFEHAAAEPQTGYFKSTGKGRGEPGNMPKTETHLKAGPKERSDRKRGRSRSSRTNRSDDQLSKKRRGGRRSKKEKSRSRNRRSRRSGGGCKDGTCKLHRDQRETERRRRKRKASRGPRPRPSRSASSEGRPKKRTRRASRR